jgi:hypothetical protein
MWGARRVPFPIITVFSAVVRIVVFVSKDFARRLVFETGPFVIGTVNSKRFPLAERGEEILVWFFVVPAFRSSQRVALRCRSERPGSRRLLHDSRQSDAAQVTSERWALYVRLT